jgi:4-alpha-glucanotransferase
MTQPTTAVPRRKTAGLLVPVFALRHADDLGIGDTRAVKEAVDFCAERRFAVLQMLPIHETVGDHSPYNAISARALSPALLSLDPGDVPGLTRDMVEKAAPAAWRAQLREGGVKHGAVHPLKIQILLSPHRAFCEKSEDYPLCAEFARFQEEQAYWLRHYTLFRLLVREYEGNPDWAGWRPEHRTVDAAEAWFAGHPERGKLAEVREGFAFIQWVAWRQWSALRAYATEKKVMLMGEMSFGVGHASVDVWANPDLFDFEWHVGTRPISYFDTNKDSERWGQNWGLPPYRWENHRSTGFAWLRDRIAGERRFFHICRLDHLRGYFRAYMFPWPGGARHAEFATLTEEEARQRTGGRLPRFVPGPDEDPVTARMNDLQGREIIGVIKEAAGDMHLIAEIMGAMPGYMRRALDDLEIASLTFPQLERNADRSLQPKDSFRARSLATYANHDHAPLAATYAHLREQALKTPGGPGDTDLQNLLSFSGWKGDAPESLTDELLAALVRALFETPCELAVLMSSDLLGTPQRFNLPGSYGAATWSERLEFPLGQYPDHAVYKKRIETVTRLIGETGREP